MMDYGHKVADKNLVAIERRMAREYKKAYEELKAEADTYFKQFESEDAKMTRSLRENKITLAEYKQWRTQEMMTGGRYQAMVTSLANKMTRINQRTMKMLNGSLTEAFIENYNYGGYEVSKSLGDNLPFTLMNQKVVEKLIREDPDLLPKPKVNIRKDRAWNKRKMNSALAQGILQGDSVDKIAKRLQSVTNMNQHSAIRNARTMTTGAENSGRLESYKDLSELGIEILKKWEATLDHVTRDSHVDLDGEVQELDKPFSNGLDYPGASGPPEEVYNCRCTMVSEVKGHKYKDERYSRLGSMTYKEWKREHGKK